MKIINGRFFRKRNTSRGERAEKFLRHFSLRGDGYADVLPRLGLVVVFVISVLLLEAVVGVVLLAKKTI